MPRIDVPAGRDPLLHLWSGTGNKLTGPAAAFSDAVYRKSTLPLREFEAARITIARVNDCRICLDLRPGGGPGQAFYDAVLGDQADLGDGADLTERESLAAEFARRFALDHLGMDYIERRPALIDSVTMADAKRVAKRLLETKAFTVVVGRAQGLSKTN